MRAFSICAFLAGALLVSGCGKPAAIAPENPAPASTEKGTRLAPPAPAQGK